jgi:hypothetical protein
MNTQVIAQKASAKYSRASHSGNSYPRRRAARIAGVSYIAMFLLAIFANFVVREGLVEPGNAQATVGNISESIGLFRLGLVAFLAIFVLDVVIAWALHVVFRDVDRDFSLATAWFRLIYTALLGVALVSMFQVIQILGSDSLGFLTAEQASAQTMIELASFESAWLVGFVAFGIHLAMLGVLIIRSGLVAKILGYILIAAGVAYVIDTLAQGMFADYEAVAGVFLVVVALPSMIGEGWLGFWLLLTKKLEN